MAAHKTIAAAALTHAVRNGSSAVSLLAQRALLGAFTLSTPLSCIAGALVWHLWQPGGGSPHGGEGNEGVSGEGYALTPGIAVLVAVASGCLMYVGAVDMVLGELWRANGAVETLLYEAQFSPQVRRPLWDGGADAGPAGQSAPRRSRQYSSDAQSERLSSAAEAAAEEEGAVAFAPFGRGRRSMRSWSSGGQSLFGALAAAASSSDGVVMTPQGASKGDYGSFFPPPSRQRASTPLLCASAALGFASMSVLAMWS